MRTRTALDPENVQAYPRPPVLERIVLPFRVTLGGETIVAAPEALRVCETHHAPTYYFAPSCFAPGTLTPVSGRSHCEWKGTARYWTVSAGGIVRPAAAWSYADPQDGFRPLKDFVALYPGQMGSCSVAGQPATPQPGGFYGGWVTPNLSGTVKGAPGTEGW